MVIVGRHVDQRGFAVLDCAIGPGIEVVIDLGSGKAGVFAELAIFTKPGPNIAVPSRRWVFIGRGSPRLPSSAVGHVKKTRSNGDKLEGCSRCLRCHVPSRASVPWVIAGAPALPLTDDGGTL
jgi:hypothetical protein